MFSYDPPGERPHDPTGNHTNREPFQLEVLRVSGTLLTSLRAGAPRHPTKVGSTRLKTFTRTIVLIVKKPQTSSGLEAVCVLEF